MGVGVGKGGVFGGFGAENAVGLRQGFDDGAAEGRMGSGDCGWVLRRREGERVEVFRMSVFIATFALCAKMGCGSA